MEKKLYLNYLLEQVNKELAETYEQALQNHFEYFLSQNYHDDYNIKEDKEEFKEAKEEFKESSYYFLEFQEFENYKLESLNSLLNDAKNELIKLIDKIDAVDELQKIKKIYNKIENLIDRYFEYQQK